MTRRLHHRGFTFVELCLGLVITALVMSAMAAFSLAMASAWKSAEKTQSLTLRGHHAVLRIEKEAQRTSTFETNRNLVLSENAKAQSVPNLEILCDDVMCGHASSVGPLEEEPLYYLQSRGLSRPRAERLLVRGFFQEVIDRLPVVGLATTVSDEVFSRFVTAQEEGRVK